MELEKKKLGDYCLKGVHTELKIDYVMIKPIGGNIA
jgi:hypothetical protein